MGRWHEKKSVLRSLSHLFILHMPPPYITGLLLLTMLNECRGNIAHEKEISCKIKSDCLIRAVTRRVTQTELAARK